MNRSLNRFLTKLFAFLMLVCTFSLAVYGSEALPSFALSKSLVARPNVYGLGKEVNLIPLEVKIPLEGEALSLETIYLIEGFIFEEFLGYGAYGSVLKVSYNGKSYALKVSKLNASTQSIFATLGEFQKKSYDHKNLVSCYGSYITINEGETHFCSYTLSELMGTDLKKLIKSVEAGKQEGYSEAHNLCFMVQLLEGLFFMHSIGVIHSDIKPANIAVNADCALKICDFGGSISKLRTSSKLEIATINYRAPELYKVIRATKEIFCFDDSIDMWSAGCVLGELLRKSPLFPATVEKTEEQILDDVLLFLQTYAEIETPKAEDDKIGQLKSKWLPKKFQQFSKDFLSDDSNAYNLLIQMLQPDPANRISAGDALKHEYFEKYHEYLEPLEESRSLTEDLLNFELNVVQQHIQKNRYDNAIKPLFPR